VSLSGGGRVDWNPQRPEQRRLITLTGKDLAAHELRGNTSTDLIAHFQGLEGSHFTRVDTAIDVLNTKANPQLLMDRFRAGRMQTHVQTVSRADRYRKDQPRDGVTVYLGSRQGERFLRVYDKAAEQGADYPWTRIELELKGDQARRAARDLVTHPIGEVAAVLTRELVKTDIKWFEAALDKVATGELVSIKPGRHQGNGERWKREVAAPAFLEALIAGESWAVQMLAAAQDKIRRSLTQT
jgi:hypothetical protein